MTKYCEEQAGYFSNINQTAAHNGLNVSNQVHLSPQLWNCTALSAKLELGCVCQTHLVFFLALI